MELKEALVQITEIRTQMARTEVFRGYRAVPAAFSGAVALAAATVQSLTIPDPMQQYPAYLALWIGSAVVSGASAVMEMMIRARNAGSSLTREQTALAMEQFFPCLAAGGLVTLVIVRSAPALIWILPGLWQVFYSLGIFATSRLLPRPMSTVAVFYAACGLTTLATSQGEWALSPLAMGLPFGLGQFLAAAVLYRTLERDHDWA
ncbi:hypothetical protein [Planctomyces sp. SH-PL62]|uniref:hypothetical protein n=1 Tax=Planctomyces sp. SH-PL62 TaxID=1636152 RepID=UPI00078E6A34|nr:hypothetical protein [Planctomyces sp. SH-PL62]AMV39299.1 hypothetical protein VT85_17810 [Planctomyces sp. SH-PL62]